ncbi:MAG: hypothetical protein WCL00_11685, partial [Bacteroidota bacterium]
MGKSSIKDIIALVSIVLTVLLFSCKKDIVDTNPSIKLTFSTDTIIFDTVFTTVGSVSQRLLVHNYNSKKIKITSIQLSGGAQSSFALNIDGKPGPEATDVEVAANDSLFIFIKVTVDPTNQNSPLIIADSIRFMTNGNYQDVKLVAWGQDAHFLKHKNLTGNITWDSLKPYVIYGSLRVDTGASLTLQPGVKLYFHSGSSLSVSHQASIKVNGTLQHPVRFLGDRLDPFYRDLPGQWGGIYLDRGSIQNEFNYAIIKNGSLGISVDSISTPDPILKIDNTIVKNVSGPGLYAYRSSILSTNCVFGDCGSAALDLEYGGSYDFRQLTIGNYWGSSVR